MAKLLLIGIIVFLGIAFVIIGLCLYYYLKRTIVKGRPLIDEPVNDQERTDKMGIGELLVHLSMIAIAGFLVIVLMRRGAVSPILGRMILLPPVMALFNARKRTGKAMLALVVSLMVALFVMMSDLIIGLPVKAPVLNLGGTEITVTQTTAADVLEDGFDIYVKQHYEPGLAYEEILSSGSFEKYPADRSLSVKEGLDEYNDPVEASPYILVKDGVVMGSITLYGSRTEDTVLEDCKIVRIRFDEDCIDAAKAKSISCTLNGVDLHAPLSRDKLADTFGKKLWHWPKNSEDVTELYYGIAWTTGSGHTFWNEYESYIHFDEKNNMTAFEITSKLPE